MHQVSFLLSVRREIQNRVEARLDEPQNLFMDHPFAKGLDGHFRLSLIEDFGPEKLKLQMVWMNFHGTFGSFFKVNVPSSMSNPHPNDRISLRAYRDKIVRMPDSLVDPSH